MPRTVLHQRTGISFRDSMIVRSAAEMGCDVLYSEDLNAGQDYSGVRAGNPFLPAGADPEQPPAVRIFKPASYTLHPPVAIGATERDRTAVPVRREQQPADLG